MLMSLCALSPADLCRPVPPEAGREEAEEAERAGRSVADRLRDEVLERAGRLQRPLADSCVQPAADRVRRLRCKQLQLPVTCAVLAPDDKFLYTGSKDCALIKCETGW